MTVLELIKNQLPANTIYYLGKGTKPPLQVYRIEFENINKLSPWKKYEKENRKIINGERSSIPYLLYNAE